MRQKSRNRRKWIIKQSLSAASAVFLLIMLSIPLLGILHPLGGLLQPRGGIFDHVGTGEHPEMERVSDSSLIGSVTVYRDEYGVPHIFSDELDDMYFAEGYVMALDRIWEMDLLRRLASGRLAEVIPAPKIPGMNLDQQLVAIVDAYFRMHGLLEAGQNLVDQIEAAGPSSIEYRMATRFLDGINKAIDVMKRTNRVPIEFKLLNYEPSKWERIDIAVIGMLISYMLSMSTRDLSNTLLEETIGEYISGSGGAYAGRDFGVLFPEANGSLPYECPVLPDNSSIFKGSTPAGGDMRDSFVKTLRFVERIIVGVNRFLGLNMENGYVQASNNWVVDGNKTLNGKPILSGDPHLIIMQPAIFYEVHLVCNSPRAMNVHGVTFPGLPVILIGFNDDVAWSITSFGSDTSVDYYTETNNDTHYFFNGSWIPMNITVETIRVRGGPDLHLKIRRTHHGPIISDLAAVGDLISMGEDMGISLHSIDELQTTPVVNLSMSWITLKKSDRNVLTCMYKLNTARNLSEFMDGLRDWTTPPQNLVFADSSGNIAMFIPGLHPTRAKGGVLDPMKYTGSYVQPGNGSGEEWVGFVPFEHMPRAINPNQSYLVSANQRSIIAVDYNYSLGSSWTENYRARRINDMINNTVNITREMMITCQADIFDVAAARFTPPLLSALAGETLAGDYNLAHQELLDWNASFFAFEMRKELVSPTVFDYYLRFLDEITWEDEWNASGASGEMYPSHQYLEYMVREDTASPWFDDITTVPVEDGGDIMVRAFKRAVDYISASRGNLSSSRPGWLWGNNHQLMPASIINAIDFFLVGIGDYIPYDGSGRTPDAAPVFGDFPAIVAGGPSWRQIVDFSRVDEPITVLPMGNSGNMFSTHWDDQLWLFVNNQYKKPSRAGAKEAFMAACIESTVLFSK
ncbi:MAG: penicillin acylase family protein [Promethearchaeota archaeon]